MSGVCAVKCFYSIFCFSNQTPGCSNYNCIFRSSNQSGQVVEMVLNYDHPQLDIPENAGYCNQISSSYNQKRSFAETRHNRAVAATRFSG